jgi:hypothetical protein
LFFALEKTTEEVGHLGAILVDLRLASLKPSGTKEDMVEKLEEAEQKLLHVALTAIELMFIPNCEKLNK